MTLNFRNRIFVFILIIQFIIFLFFAFSIYNQCGQYLNFNINKINDFHINYLLFSLTSLIISLYLFNKFYKNNSPDIFYYLLFISLYSLNAFSYFIQSLSLIEISQYFIVNFYKLLYGLHLASILSFFVVSLFIINLEYQKFGPIFNIIFLISAAMSFFLPIELIQKGIVISFSHKDSEFFIWSIVILSITNYLINLLRQLSRRNILMLLLSIIIITTCRLLFMNVSSTIILHCIFLFSNLFFVKTLYSLYIWS